MKAQHTPGPYRAEGPDPFGDYNILHRADSLAVAAVVSNMRHDAEVEANARLIAAAPELLSALKAMVLNDRHTYRDCHKAALAAIAKATGEV